jgi:hypothetical protein
VPFTLSHPAAVIPLARRPLVASALIIGAMAPDLPYYLPLPVAPDTTHSWAGVVGVDIVLTLALLAVFQLMLAEPMLALLPASWRSRLVDPAAGFRLGTPADVAWLVLSAGLGAATHVGWDAFTHVDGQAVEVLPVLREVVFGLLPVYRSLQYASTIVGAAVLVWWLRRWYRRTPPAPVPDRLRLSRSAQARVAVAMGAATVAGAVIKIVAWHGGDGREAGYDLIRVGLIQGLFGAGAGVAAAVVGYAAGWHLVRRFSGRSARSVPR